MIARAGAGALTISARGLGASTIKTLVKRFLTAFIAILSVALVFALGQWVRLASIEPPMRHVGAIGARSYTLSDARIGKGGILPYAVADESTSPSAPPVAGSAPAPTAADDRQIEDLLNSDSPAATFQQVYLLLKNQFVDKIDTDDPLAHGAASAMIASLDEPNSRFMNKAERKAMDEQETGLFEGIGAAFTVRKLYRSGNLLDRQITVIDALPGTPAEKAGLHTGDVITAIDGHWIITYDPFQQQAAAFKKLVNDPYTLNKQVDALEKNITAGYTLDKAQSLLDTTDAQPLKLSVMRPGVSAPFTVTLDISAPTQVKDIESRKLSDGNGYIGVNVFTSSTGKDFTDAVAGLGDVKGLVVDLRDCAGGMLDPAMQIAHALAPTSTFGQVVMRNGTGDKSLGIIGNVPTRIRDLDTSDTTALSSIAFHGPVSVLVNKGTANTAEMLAAFLHDRAGAHIIGTGTFGDATTQTLFPLTDGSAFALTTGVLKTDSGVAFNKMGLAPEYALADPGHAGSGPDPGLAKAVLLLAAAPARSAPNAHPLQAASAPSVPGILIPPVGFETASAKTAAG